MSKFLASLAVATSLLAGIATANAGPASTNWSERAEAHQISPHGVFDAR